MSGPTDLHAEYVHAVESVTVHRIRQAKAETALIEWKQSHKRGARPPAHLVDAAVKAAADVEWCRALVLACGEAFKGEPLDVVIARNEAHRPRAGRARLGQF